MHLLAVHTPWGTYEWTVMPMGVHNAPAFHQHHMVTALHHLIGKICHVYLDDIIIWSQTLDEHERNVRAVLEALRAAWLFCSLKKTSLFNLQVDFLGHHISARGVEADPKKIERIQAWPTPKKCNDVRAFLGLVQYLSSHVPNVAEHTHILTLLTTKEAERQFPGWTTQHQNAFEALKALIISPACLTVINHDEPSENLIFLTCDASDYRTGAVLSWGPTWETACPVAFESYQLHDAQLNYPVHEKKLLAVIKALKKWRIELLGAPVHVYTDHRTLEFFNTQKALSRRQAHWQEYMSQFDLTFHYIKGERNLGADALSCTMIPDSEATPLQAPALVEDDLFVCAINPANRLTSFPLDEDPLFSMTCPVSAVLDISQDITITHEILKGYQDDEYCRKLFTLIDKFPNLVERGGLLFLSGRLVIPCVRKIREHIFRLAHDTLGHFGGDKSYEALHGLYYWPNMRKELLESYIPSCVDCMRNKSPTTAPAGPLHPLLVPDRRGDSIAMDFIGPLPMEEGYNMIITITDHLNADICILSCKDTITARELASLFFDHWYCENGLPLHIVSDRDKLFISKFWRVLHRLTGVKLKLSSSYHPQTDGVANVLTRQSHSVIITLSNEIKKVGSKCSPHVWFNIMNTVNASTGYTPFQLHLRRSPRLLPPIVLHDEDNSSEVHDAATFLTR
jgi:hypothetical protein